jgi:hypothetical protein
MHSHGKTKIRRHSIANVRPVFGTIVGAIQAPMILQEETFGAIGMHRDFMYALPELGILIGHEHGADAPVLRSPCTSAIVGAVDAPSRDRHVHPLVVGRIEQNSVQGESSITRHPAGTMWMIEEAAH